MSTHRVSDNVETNSSTQLIKYEFGAWLCAMPRPFHGNKDAGEVAHDIDVAAREFFSENGIEALFRTTIEKSWVVNHHREAGIIGQLKCMPALRDWIEKNLSSILREVDAKHRRAHYAEDPFVREPPHDH